MLNVSMILPYYGNSYLGVNHNPEVEDIHTGAGSGPDQNGEDGKNQAELHCGLAIVAGVYKVMGGFPFLLLLEGTINTIKCDKEADFLNNQKLSRCNV